MEITQTPTRRDDRRMTATVTEGACRKRSVPMAEPADDGLVDRIADALAAEFGDELPASETRRIAVAAVEQFASVAVANFVPILAFRAAREMARERQSGNGEQ